MTVNGGDCDWGSGDLCRTGLVQSCTVNVPKHCDHTLDGQRATVLLNWKFCVFPFQLLFGFIYSSIQNQKPMPWSSFQSSSKLMSLHSQNHKTICWNSWTECKLPRKYPLALRWHSGAFSPGQCDWGPPRILAIVCGKHLCFHHWLFLCYSLRPWAPSTTVAEQVTYPHILTNSKLEILLELYASHFPP